MRQSQEMLGRILAKHLLRIPDEVWLELRALQAQLDEDFGEIEELQAELKDAEEERDRWESIVYDDTDTIDRLKAHIKIIHNAVLAELGVR